MALANNDDNLLYVCNAVSYVASFPNESLSLYVLCFFRNGPKTFRGRARVVPPYHTDKELCCEKGQGC